MSNLRQLGLFEVPFPHERQPSYDGAATRQARDAGMHAALTGTSAEWRELAKAYIQPLLARQAVVTPDDLRVAVPIEPRHSNVWGSFIRSLETQGWITRTGRLAVSKRVVGHANRVLEYRSNLYRGVLR